MGEREDGGTEQVHSRRASPAPTLDAHPHGPLAGLMVADFSRVLAGPYASMMLADLGATVIKVEGPAGDDTRTWKPPVFQGVATYYMAINRNKRSIVLDLKSEGDRELAHRLIGRADVLIENFRPAQRRDFGLEYETLHERHPALVVASITTFGSSGKGAELPGYDLMVQAISGLMSVTGDSDGPAMKCGMSVCDILAGSHAAIGVLAALVERQLSGLGQHVEVSLLASTLSGLAHHSAAWTIAGVVPHRMGNAHPSLAPYEPLPTADGELIVIAANDRQFRALAGALGKPELADRPEFRHNEDRTSNRELLRGELIELLRARGAAEWFRVLTEADLPCAPILGVDQGIAMAEELGMAPTVPVPSASPRFEMVRNPLRFSRSGPRYDFAPPGLGEDGEAVRAWLTSE